MIDFSRYQLGDLARALDWPTVRLQGRRVYVAGVLGIEIPQGDYRDRWRFTTILNRAQWAIVLGPGPDPHRMRLCDSQDCADCAQTSRAIRCALEAAIPRDALAIERLRLIDIERAIGDLG